jgi:tetratricopeptide (TPR) repeat protein
MKYCYHCGYLLSIGEEKFCPECGKKLEQQVAVRGDDNESLTSITDTKGDVTGTDVSGNQNVISKEIGGYTRQGNIIHLHVGSISSDVLEKIINAPTQIDINSAQGGSINDNKKIQETVITKQQTSQLLEEIKKIEDKEGGSKIEEIKAGDMQISRNELESKVLILKGNEHYDKKEYEEAIKNYDKAIELDPKYSDPWNNKGISLAILGKDEEAIECFDKALAIDPNYVLAWNNKGNALTNLGKYNEAIECYDKAIQIKPDDAMGWYNKGNVLGKLLGKYNEAIECFDKALAIDPNSPDAWNNKGISLRILGKSEEAIECYDKVLRIDPNFTSAQNNRKLALEDLINQKK